MAKEIGHLQKHTEGELLRVKREWSIEQLQIKELRDSLETEQYSSTLYKTQTNELKEELEEKNRINNEFDEERASREHQCQITLARADSEALARSIAKETIAYFEKEKTMKEREIKDLLIKHVNDLNSKEYALSLCKERENKYKKHNDQLLKENDELNRHLKQVQEELNNKIDYSEEVEKLKSKLKTESLLKQHAVNKLNEVLNRKQRPQTELNSIDSEIEQLQMKLASLNNETASLSSADNEGDDFSSDKMFEGWLSIPIKQNNIRHGWRKQYVVLSSKNIFFYNSENDKQNTDPVNVLDLCKVFHVRSVTQGEVIRAHSKVIPRIFQLLYAKEGETRKTEEQGNMLDVRSIKGEDKPGAVMHKGHEFFQISYHMPTTCEVCPKRMWHMFLPPPALECRRCRTKIHKEHLDRKEDHLALCKLHDVPDYPTELLLLAPSVDDQKHWVCRLSKKIQKSRNKANNSNAIDPAKISPK